MKYYEEARMEAESFTRTYEPPKNPIREGRIVFAIIVVVVLYELCQWAMYKGYAILDKVLFWGLAAFVLVCVVRVWAFFRDDSTHFSNETYLHVFTYQKFFPHMVRYFYPEVVFREGISRELAVRSGHIGNVREKYYQDYGTWCYRTDAGRSVLLTQVVMLLEMHSNENGLLLCFEQVLQEEVAFPVLILCNIDEHEREIGRKYGLASKRRAPELDVTLHSLERGAIGKCRIAKEDKAFSYYYLAYCENQEFGETFVNAPYRRKLLDLHEKYGDLWFGISYVGKDVYVYIDDRLSCHVGTYKKVEIREDLFQQFYRFLAQPDALLENVLR